MNDYEHFPTKKTKQKTNKSTSFEHFRIQNTLKIHRRYDHILKYKLLIDLYHRQIYKMTSYKSVNKSYPNFIIVRKMIISRQVFITTGINRASLNVQINCLSVAYGSNVAENILKSY